MKRSSALLALSALALPYRAGAQTLTKVTLVSTAGTAPGPAVYAEKVGLFRKYGLDVVHTQMNSGAAIVAAVVGGSADIGSGSSFSVVTAYAHGIPMQMFAAGPVFNASDAIPYGMILVGKNAAFKTAADLNGKTFGLAIARGDLNATATQAWIEQHGGDWSKRRATQMRTRKRCCRCSQRIRASIRACSNTRHGRRSAIISIRPSSSPSSTFK
jgi:ABC-type nitrate/sulfonate/bicarbonate transport system substrate-binding protein